MLDLGIAAIEFQSKRRGAKHELCFFEDDLRLIALCAGAVALVYFSVFRRAVRHFIKRNARLLLRLCIFSRFLHVRFIETPKISSAPPPAVYLTQIKFLSRNQIDRLTCKDAL